MNLVCVVKVDVKAFYDFVEPRTLDVSLKDYTHYGSASDFFMSEQGNTLNYHKTLELRFNNMADFMDNFEKELLLKMSEKLRFIDNWNVAYDIKQVRGADVYF